jgi:hypothetical protein
MPTDTVAPAATDAPTATPEDNGRSWPKPPKHTPKP